MNKKIIILTSIVLLVIFYFIQNNNYQKNIPEELVNINEKKEIEKEKISSEIILNEAGNMTESSSASWWLNAGGLCYFDDNKFKTIQGDLDKNNKWHQAYLKNNPRDTDNGKHPQNIFRLVSRGKWKNLDQQAYFKINKDNLSSSSYRNESNGLLFFNRYQDGNNLYYTGIRVDGFAVIKKKMGGKYFTMAYNRIVDGKYDRNKNPDLLPEHQAIGLKSEIKNEADGSVSIKLLWDKEKTGNWELIAEARDNGKKYGGKAFLNEGYAGIRTDFMDVEFDDYKIEEIK